MTIERDFVGIVMSFTIGIVISTVASTSFTTPSSAAFLMSTACLAVLMHPKHNDLSSNALWALINILFICLGFFISDTGRFAPLHCNPLAGSLSGYAESVAEKLKILIENIPFRETETNSLVCAFITGDRSGLSPEILGAFRRSGASHILALSGLHLGIIYGILKGILSFAGNGRTAKVMRAAAVVSICGFYTLATGAGASTTRAFLFIILNETASLTGRYRSTGSILWAALFIQLFFKPESISDVGFQLSYAAMAGIAYIFPHMKNLWPEAKNSGIVNKGLRWIWVSAAMSIACQITTGPLAWIYFGTFPKYFLLTNLISLPLIGIIIPASLMTLGLHACGICPDFIIGGTEWLILGLARCLEIIAGL